MEDRSGARLLSHWPTLVVLLWAAWLVWPVPLGQMPMSADHTVHLARIAMTGRRLVEHGALSGWEPTWFFGFPLGDLYPPLGDLLIIVVRGASLGLLDWPQAYALGFTIVFAVQGLVLVRLGRLFGLGAWPGTIAALLLLGDPGFTREGGWMYSVYFGVWPQALATSLVWLGFGECALAIGATPGETPSSPDHVRAAPWFRAGLALGASALAHPIAVPSLVIGMVLFVAIVVPRAALAWRVAVARLCLVGLLAAALAAWWWVPMLQHKAWMASYGWLHAPLRTMTKWLMAGQWAQRMPAAIGWLALAGMIFALVPRSHPGQIVLRWVAAFALLQWIMASSDVFWRLRLDRFSDGFAHLQWQRFLIAAKPGIYLCAGAAVVFPANLARTWAETRLRIAALPLAALAAGLAAWLLADQRAGMNQHQVGTIQLERMPGDPEFDDDYHALLAWLGEQGQPVAFRESRNSHWFMDAPLWIDVPIYKIGFTPGDNFVHKPEHGGAEVLDALGVRYIVTRGKPRDVPGQAARFGSLIVREHSVGPRELARLEGPGEVGVRVAALRAGRIQAEFSGAQGGRLVFMVAGYPRWQATLDGEPIEWIEVPVWGEGEAITPSERRAGILRGGNATGDDGSEPTLMAIELPPEVSSGMIELTYRRWSAPELLAELLSAFALLGVMLFYLARQRPIARRITQGLVRAESGLARAVPILLVSVVVVVSIGAAARWHRAIEGERGRLIGLVDRDAVQLRRAELGPVKTDMLIRPSVVLRPRRDAPAQVSFELDRMGERVQGWMGIDDDEAQRRGRWARHHVVVAARELGADAPFSTLVDVQVQHAPGRLIFDVDAGALAGRSVEVRIIDTYQSGPDGGPLPRLGMDLELGEPR